MGRGRGMPKPKKSAQLAPEPVKSKASHEETGMKDDGAPIVITRTDPNFDAREKLAEELWEREKAEFDAEEGQEEADQERQEPAEEDAPDEQREEAGADKEEVEGEPEEAEEVEGDERTEEEEAQADEQEDEYETLTVDGQQTKKTKSEIYEAGKRALQKDLSADRRLEEATRLLRETQATVQAQLPKQGAAQQRQLQPVPTAEQQQKIKALYEKLRYGDDDEGQQALEELLRGRDATPQMDTILSGVGLYLERERIRSAFMTPTEQGGYADIYPMELGGKCEDPEVWGYFDYQVNQLLNSGKPQDMSTYREAADKVRTFYGEKKPRGVQASLAHKRERKKQIDVVRGVKAKTPATKQDKDEMTHEDILNEHRKFRGLMGSR